MTNPSHSIRVFDEFLWSLRREGFEISPAQAVDAIRAVEVVGLARKDDVRHAVAAIVVHRSADLDRFDTAFNRFFAPDAAFERARTLWDRLSAAGFDEAELGVLRALLADLRATGAEGHLSFDALLERSAEFDRALVAAGIARDFEGQGALQLGFFTHRLLSRIGAGAAHRTLATLRTRLVAAIGPRGEALADALALDLERAEQTVRDSVLEGHESRRIEADREQSRRRLSTTPFATLTDSQIEEVRLAVRSFAQRLRGKVRARARRRALRGRIDPHRTLRRALRTGGVPFALVRLGRRRERPKLMVLCDVSDSVRAAASFLLEFTYAVQDLFERARSFVFVSDLGETTALFTREPVRVAMARAWSGEVVRAGDNSNYGRVLRAFEARYSRDLDLRTTVVILGDGRTNYHDPAVDALERIRKRTRAVLWLCPESRGQWGQGDSSMTVYARYCTAVYEVRCAADLERAARVLLSKLALQ